MHRKFLFFSFCLLFSSIIVCAQLTIIPKKGKIVFTSENIVYDEGLFRADMKIKQQKMINQIRSEMGFEEGQNVDTTILRQFLNTSIMADFMSKRKDIDYTHVYENRFIKSFESVDDEEPNHYSYINQDSSTYMMIQVLSGDTIGTESFSFAYQKNKDVSIKEFKSDQKIINGLKCFKVIYQYKENFDDDELSEILTSNEYSSSEFWVTDKIKSLFHPVCRVKEILEKYYPLEIIEKSALAKGFKVIHKLKKNDLSN